MKKLFVLLVVMLTVVSLVFAQGAQEAAPAAAAETTAEWVPNKTITILVGMKAGGGIDGMARTIAPALSEYLGVDVVVENMPGSSSGVAADYICDRDADGLYIFATSSSMCGFATTENSDVTYNDMDMLVMPFTTHNPAIIVKADSGIETWADFEAMLKAGNTTASNAGVGSTWHFPALMVAEVEGTLDKLSNIPYSSGKETALAVARGEVDWSTCGIYAESGEAIRAGQVKPIAVLSAKAFELDGYGTVPSILDMCPEFEKYVDIVGGWRGFAVKKGTPANIEAKLTEALDYAMHSEAFIKLLTNNGVSVDDALTGEAAQKLFEKSSRIFSYYLYDLGDGTRDPQTIGVPRWN